MHGFFATFYYVHAKVVGPRCQDFIPPHFLAVFSQFLADLTEMLALFLNCSASKKRLRTSKNKKKLPLSKRASGRKSWGLCSQVSVGSPRWCVYLACMHTACVCSNSNLHRMWNLQCEKNFSACMERHRPLGGGGGSGHDKLPKLARQKALKKSLRIKDQSCPVLCLSHNAMW